jgi:hypothetical protein
MANPTKADLQEKVLNQGEAIEGLRKKLAECEAQLGTANLQIRRDGEDRIELLAYNSDLCKRVSELEACELEFTKADIRVSNAQLETSKAKARAEGIKEMAELAFEKIVVMT